MMSLANETLKEQLGKTKELFDFHFDRVLGISYNTAWANGLYRFDYALSGSFEVKLDDGEILKSISPNGRKIIFIGTHFGPVAIFQLYPGSYDIIGVNSAERIVETYITDNSFLSYHDMLVLLGDIRGHKPNIGLWIKAFIGG